MKIKKNVVMVCLILFFCSLAGIAYSLFFNTTVAFDEKRQSNVMKIAIFQPATHPALDEIAQGFIDTMNSGSGYQYSFSRYNGNGNKILMQAQAQEILQQKYDLIFTIGVGCSVTIKDLCHKKNNQTPQVFTAVDDPAKLNLQGPTITGVIDQSNYKVQLDHLVSIIPTMKKLLLVYDQSQASGLEKDKHQIRSILQAQSVDLLCIEIMHISEIAQKITSSLPAVDCVMILKDNTLVSGIDSLITLCERYHVPLLASDLNSGEKGAALAYGLHEIESGIQAAYQAKLILEDAQFPHEVPVISVKNMHMMINCLHAHAQGLVIDYDNFVRAGVQFNKKGCIHA